MTQTMLIIDDDTAVLASCQRIFSQEGFEVTTTTNPPWTASNWPKQRPTR